ncbi:MAG: hypothetical protein LBR34_07830 [Prevotella sp.]|jgi:hypothetical protein|nr:hypothetical protein [Prevotella sp.]
MITGKKTIALLLALTGMFALSAQTEWRIIGGGAGEEGILLKQNPDNTQEFIYTGRLTGQWFKITDGSTVYVPLCGDSDPLGQTLTLRSQDNQSETGLRIRYVGSREFFTVTLNATRLVKKISVVRAESPQSLYIMGGPFNKHDPNWLLDDAVEMERDSLNPFVFYYRGELRYNTFGDERGSIKFLLGRTWNDNYHPAGTTNVPLLQAAKIRLNGADTKWTIPADRSGDGYYVIKVNTLDETIDVKFTSELAVNPAKQDKKIKVFASGGKVFVQCIEEDALKVDLFGVDGRKMTGKTVSGAAEINVNKGCYIVRTTTGSDEVSTTKVLVYN